MHKGLCFRLGVPRFSQFIVHRLVRVVRLALVLIEDRLVLGFASDLLPDAADVDDLFSPLHPISTEGDA